MIWRILALLVLFAFPWVGEACIELVAELPEGPVKAVDFEGDLAVLGAGKVLIVADLSDPALPVELGRIIMPEVIQAIDLADGNALVVLERSSIGIVDLADPTAPVVVGVIEPSSPTETTVIVDVAVEEPYAFIAESIRGDATLARLHVVDISDPSAPVSVGVAERWGAAVAVEAAGDLVFLANTGSFQIYDVTDAAVPVELYSAWGINDVSDIDLAGDTLFVLHNHHAVLKAFDVANPETPELISSLGLGMNYPTGLAVADGLAFAVSWRDEMMIVAVEDPAQPVIRGSLDIPGTPVSVSASGERAVVAAYSGGLRIIDVGDGGRPVESGFIATLGSSDYITVVDEIAVVSSHWSGKPRLLDLSDPAHPIELGTLPVESLPGRVDVEGMFAYVMTGAVRGPASGVSIISISDPLHAEEIGFASTFIPPGDVDVQWPYAYIIEDYALQVFDVRIPSTPVRVTFMDHQTDPRSTSITVAGDSAFVGRAPCFWGFCPSSIRSLDFSDPLNPIECGSITGMNPRTPVIRDGYLFGMKGLGLVVIDVGDPETPELVYIDAVDEPDPYQRGKSVALCGDVAATMTSYPARLDLYDITSPTWPRVIGRYEIPGKGMDVGLSGDFAYVAGGDEGIYVYDVSACGLPTPRDAGGRATP